MNRPTRIRDATARKPPSASPEAVACRQEIIRLSLLGKTVPEIVEATGAQPGHVYSTRLYARRRGVKLPPLEGRRGTAQGNAAWQDLEVRRDPYPEELRSVWRSTE